MITEINVPELSMYIQQDEDRIIEDIDIYASIDVESSIGLYFDIIPKVCEKYNIDKDQLLFNLMFITNLDEIVNYIG